MKRGYPTPNAPTTITMTTRCVPIPDIPEFIALIGGLLFEATRPSFWDESGDMSPQECADLMADTLGVFDSQEECAVDSTPIASVVWLPSPTIPTKWHICDGATLLRSEYPALYDALPDFQFVQVGTGLDIIILPNLTDSFLYGANNDTEIADTGGAATHQLTVAEMPAHTHSTPNHVNTIPIADNTGTASRVARGGTTNATNFNTNSSGGGTSGSQGSDTAHNNMPPYMRGYWIMKVLP